MFLLCVENRLCQLKIGSVRFIHAIYMSNICLAVLTTAARRSGRRQQYRNGLIDEFINVILSAKIHVLVSSMWEIPNIIMEINNGV